ncbi:hypothetical protein LCGC14_2988640, partial [marine sediment metagenome]
MAPVYNPMVEGWYAGIGLEV